MGITINCPNCGTAEEANHPVVTPDGVRGMIDPETPVPCVHCGADLAKLMHDAQCKALAPSRRKKRITVIAVLVLGIVCIVSGKIWRDVAGLRVWTDIHNYLREHAVIKDVEMPNLFNMN